jgi:nucleoid-associated protein YgaU
MGLFDFLKGEGKKAEAAPTTPISSIPAGPPTSAAGSRTYTVKAGDTLSKIAKEQLGDASKYRQLFDANRSVLSDPDKIYPGQVLQLPTSLAA